MPYHEVAIGEEWLAADFNTYVARQVVATFVNDGQRTSQLASPDKGQVSYLDTHPSALWLWDGASWREPSSPRHTSGVNLHAQCGNEVVTTNGAGGGQIVFPVPFAAPPVTVLLTDMGGGAALCFQFSVIYSQVVAASCGFIARNHLGVPVNTGGVRVGWLAYGERALD